MLLYIIKYSYAQSLLRWYLLTNVTLAILKVCKSLAVLYPLICSNIMLNFTYASDNIIL